MTTAKATEGPYEIAVLANPQTHLESFVFAIGSTVKGEYRSFAEVFSPDIATAESTARLLAASWSLRDALELLLSVNLGLSAMPEQVNMQKVIDKAHAALTLSEPEVDFLVNPKTGSTIGYSGPPVGDVGRGDGCKKAQFVVEGDPRDQSTWHIPTEPEVESDA